MSPKPCVSWNDGIPIVGPRAWLIQLPIAKGAVVEMNRINYLGPRLIRRRPIAANLSLGRNLLMCGAICIGASQTLISPAKFRSPMKSSALGLSGIIWPIDGWININIKKPPALRQGFHEWTGSGHFRPFPLGFSHQQQQRGDNSIVHSNAAWPIWGISLAWIFNLSTLMQQRWCKSLSLCRPSLAPGERRSGGDAGWLAGRLAQQHSFGIRRASRRRRTSILFTIQPFPIGYTHSRTPLQWEWIREMNLIWPQHTAFKRSLIHAYTYSNNKCWFI